MSKRRYTWADAVIHLFAAINYELADTKAKLAQAEEQNGVYLRVLLKRAAYSPGVHSVDRVKAWIDAERTEVNTFAEAAAHLKETSIVADATRRIEGQP